MGAMPLDASLVGTELGRLEVRPDARWLMAYASGVPDERPELYDTRSALATHPLFAVAPEWELLITTHSTPRSMPRHESVRGVHFRHDVVVHRGVRPDETITLTAEVVGVDRHRAGCTQDVLFRAVDADGRPVWQTLMTSLFRGVELTGEPVRAAFDWDEWGPAAAPAASPDAELVSHVRTVDAHVYTECARIWNPIHTDVAFANGAGLDVLILHGTATLARAVSLLTAHVGAGPAEVRRVRGRFGAMVELDTDISVRLLAASPDRLDFDVRNAAGQPAVADGAILLGPAEG